MIDEDTYCIDVLTQVCATTSALQSVALGLLDDHLRHCVTEAVVAGGPEGAAKVDEATEGHPAAGAVMSPGRAAAGARRPDRSPA